MPRTNPAHIAFRRLVGVAALAAGALGAGPAAANERAAVLELRGPSSCTPPGPSERSARELCSVLATFTDEVRAGLRDATRARGYDVLSRENMRVLVGQMGGVCSEGECEVETGRLLQASLVASGEALLVDGVYLVTLKLHETRGGTLLELERLEGRTRLDVIRALRPATKRMVENGLAALAPPVVAAPARAPAPPPPSRPTASAAAAAAPAPAAFTAPVTPAPPLGRGRLGVINTASGPEAPIGEHLTNGYRLAQEELRARGLEIEIMWQDDGGKPQNATSAFAALASSGVSAVVGPYTSASAAAAAAVAERHQIPLVVPAAAKNEITAPGSPWVFRVNAPASAFGPALVDAALAMGSPAPRTIAFLYESTDFGKSVARFAREHAERRGLAVSADESYQKGSSDFRGVLERARGADLVFMVSYVADAIQLMRQARALGIAPKAFLGGGAGFDTAQFLGEREVSESVLVATQWTPQARWPGAASFAERYRARFGNEPTYHAALAYEALRIAGEAAIRAGGDPARLREELTNGTWDGLAGPVDFADYDGFRNQNRHEMVVNQVQGGARVPVHPPSAAIRPAVYPFRGW